MNIIDAAHQSAREFPGGAEALAQRLGMRAKVLRNKLNARNTTHHLTLIEADAIMDITGDHRILQALADAHGFVLTKAEPADDGASMLSTLLSKAGSDGQFAVAVEEALADGVISDNEMRAINACAYGVQRTFVNVLGKLRQMNDAARPMGADA